MNYFRLILGFVVGVFVLSAVAEGIEFLIVSSASGMSYEEIASNQDAYFEVRNTPSILAAKVVYNSLAALLAGFLASLVMGKLSKIGMAILVVFQTGALVWGAFFSEFAATSPLWLWVVLIVITPIGLIFGHLARTRMLGRSH